MSEDFYWVNVERKEFICPVDLGYSGHSHGSSYRDNDVLRALRELLSSDWKECHVFFMGENCQFPKGVADNLSTIMLKQCEEAGLSPGDYLGLLYEAYRNISCLFICSEQHVQEEINWFLEDVRNGELNPYHNEYRLDPSDPYKGLFVREGKSFKYTLNYTKKRAYCSDADELLFEDPLPDLAGCGDHIPPGPWLGDIIGVDNSLPQGFTLIEDYWGELDR